MAVGPYAAGTPYSAEDPALVLWVHATLLDSVPLVYERLVAPLSLEERDTYCREAAPVAVALGAREAEVPQSWADLRRYLDRMYQSGGIVVGDTARALARAVTAPRGSLLVAPVRWANLVLTIGLLPPPIREQYRFAWGVRDERALSLLVAAIRAGRRVTPRQLALWKDARTM